MNNSEARSLFEPTEDVLEQDVDVMNIVLYVKDYYNVSGDAFHELASICKHLPRQYKIKQRIAELNSLWNIKPTPSGTVGLQQSLEERLHVRLAHLLRLSPPDARFVRERALHVKLSGDGTKIGKRLHIVNFTFTLLQEGSAAHSSQGNHFLAVMKEPEKYDQMKLALADIPTEIETLNSIEHGGKQFKVSSYLGGDF